MNNLIDNFVQYCDWANQIDQKRRQDNKNPAQRNFSKTISSTNFFPQNQILKNIKSPKSQDLSAPKAVNPFKIPKNSKKTTQNPNKKFSKKSKNSRDKGRKNKKEFQLRIREKKKELLAQTDKTSIHQKRKIKFKKKQKKFKSMIHVNKGFREAKSQNPKNQDEVDFMIQNETSNNSKSNSNKFFYIFLIVKLNQ